VAGVWFGTVGEDGSTEGLIKGRFLVQAGLILHQAYIPEKCHAN